MLREPIRVASRDAAATQKVFRDPAVLMMPASLILCGLLLDRATLAVTTTVTALATVGVLLFSPGDARAAVADILDSVAILAITGVGVGIVVGRLRRGIERLRAGEAVAPGELRPLYLRGAHIRKPKR